MQSNINLVYENYLLKLQTCNIYIMYQPLELETQLVSVFCG